MKTGLGIIIKSIVGALGTLLLLAGAFGGAIGIANGWGHPYLAQRLVIGLVGFLVATTGFFIMYWASDKNVDTLLRRYVLGWIFWR